MLESLATFRAAGAVINMFLRQSLKQWSLGLEDQALQSLWLSRKCYDYWMKDTKVDFNDRRKMQPIRILLRDQVASFMESQDFDPLAKARLWKSLPADQRRLTYDGLAPYFERLAAAQDPPWDVTKAFPEPPGMAEFRQTDPDYRSPDRPKDVEQGQRYRN